MKRKKRIASNILMAVLIVVIAAAGVMTVGSVKGWFDRPAQASAPGEPAAATATARADKGIANMERDGVAFSLGTGRALRTGDLLETRAGSELSIQTAGGTLVFSENTEATVENAASESFSLQIHSGEVFAVANETGMQIAYGGKTVRAADTALLFSVQTGSDSLNVFQGSVSVSGGAQATAASGQTVSCVNGAVETSAFTAASLNQFAIEKAKAAGAEKALCFTAEQLDEVLSSREAERQAAIEAQARHDAQVIARGGTEKVQGGAGSAGQDGSDAENSGGDASGPALNCTIEIRCDTILNNMENLREGKNAYVPANGVILSTSTVEFTQGETVFDVLNRVCQYADIQIEYSWTPAFGSYYIEGLNHLYEFDCGNLSGWMYKVNGWFPNYGCSSYTLKDGDVIVWCYTCNDLGADVGGSV